jgi:hypothetical protein
LTFLSLIRSKETSIVKKALEQMQAIVFDLGLDMTFLNVHGSESFARKIAYLKMID